MKKMGQLDVTVTADIPTYTVFKNTAGEKTYIAYNPASDSVTVHFSDNYSMQVPPRQMKSLSTSPNNMNAPVAILAADRTSGKIPLTVNFIGSRSFDRNGSPLSFHWNFGDGGSSTATDTAHVFTEPGNYKVILTVTNQLNFTSKDSVNIRVLGNGTPYTGTPVMMPGIIEAENYDNGGEGIAYHDVNANNIGLLYRPNEGVDIEGASEHGYDVYWMVAGEWLEYTIQVPVDTLYDIIPYVATVPGFGNFRIFVNNVDVSGKRAVPSTGGWQSWVPITIPNVPLHAGVNILRVEVNTDVASERKNWLFSLNYIKVNQSIINGISDDKLIPEVFSLSQNYPNPFNPSTVIRFQLPVSGMVKLIVYNTLGEKVAEVINKEMEAGYHSVDFNGTNFSSGIYFYELKCGEFSSVKKMILLR
jgi:PKD repeat protein